LWPFKSFSLTPGSPTAVNSVGSQFDEAQKDAGVKIAYRGHYGLRHTLETIGGEVADQIALDVVMGHVDSTMAGRYRQSIGDDRVRKVCDHVRTWLFSDNDSE
jgi:hypothetical protein